MRHIFVNVSAASTGRYSRRVTSGEAFARPTPAFAQAMAGGETSQTRATPAAAFARAREIIRQGARLDMAALAADIGVSRATLYRWTKDRERLLADVVWAELSAMIDHFDRRTAGTGFEHLVTAVGDFLDALAGNDALHAFLTNEGASGLRLVTDHRGGVRPRLLTAISAIIAREAAGGYRAPDDPELIADGILALGERWLYHDGSPELNPDPAMARRVIVLLLRESG